MGFGSPPEQSEWKFTNLDLDGRFDSRLERELRHAAQHHNLAHAEEERGRRIGEEAARRAEHHGCEADVRKGAIFQAREGSRRDRSVWEPV